MFNLDFKSRGMSVGSRGRQAVISVEQFVECAIPQMPTALSTERLQWNVKELIQHSSNDV